MRVLVPDSWGLEQNFYDVTIVDMGDLPESSLSMNELSILRWKWPPAILRHMVWLQQDLEVMRPEAKKRFRNTRLGRCSYCGTWIKCDMYRYVAKFHLDLAQLWRCPVSWCTVWKGTPQDRIHKRGLPHIAFTRDYMARLQALLSPAVAQSQGDMLSPVSSGPVSMRHARSAELELELPRRTRHA